MTRTPDFDALYAADGDPWRVATSGYEQRKLGVVLASLTRPAYASAWDPGCGTGHLARRLADRSEEVLATDLAAEAVRITRATCAGLDHVEVRRQSLPAPPGGRSPDLAVLSEFLYYLDDGDRRQSLLMLDEVLAPAAEVVAVHWRGRPDDAYLSGPAVQEEIRTALTGRGWEHVVHHRDDHDPEGSGMGFVLDVLHRRGGRA